MIRLADFKVIVFDLDDTLVLERDYVISGFEAVANRLNEEFEWSTDQSQAFYEECRSLFENGHRGNTFDKALATIGGHQARPDVSVLVDTYRSHKPTLNLLPDAQTCLEQLTGQKEVWVITDGPLVSQRAKVEAIGLTRWTERIVFTDRWGRAFWKPQPRAFQHVQEASGALAEDHVYIADNPTKDFIGPQRLGWSSIRIRRPHGLHTQLADLDDCPPDATITSLMEI